MNPILAVASLLLSTCVCAQMPTFEQYPVTSHYTGPVRSLKLISAQDKEFRSHLAETAQRPVNFAGHYVLSTVGCGASCVLTSILDAKTGRVSWLPFSLGCWNSDVLDPVQFRLDSDLLVLSGKRDEASDGTSYMRLVAGRFQTVSAIENPPR